MSSEIGEGEPIYINGNHLDEELILTARGELEEGLHPFTDEIGQAVGLGVGPDNPKPKGAIFYLHCNIPEDSFAYK